MACAAAPACCCPASRRPIAAPRPRACAPRSPALEAESDGRDSLRARPNRNSIRGGLVGAAQQQAGVDRAARLAELRRQYQELSEEITRGEAAASERQRTEQEAAAGQAAEARRRRTAADAEELRKALDDRFRITSEYDDRVRRLREAEAAGGITSADRTRLETLALRERDEALRRIEGTTRRVAAIPRRDREAEREINEIIRERERLIQANENPQERYTRRLETLGSLVERSERIGQPIPDETVSREALDALNDLEAAQNRLQASTSKTADVARELGMTFASAFEDAIVNGKSLSDIAKGLERDLLRIGTRTLVTEPLAGLPGGCSRAWPLASVIPAEACSDLSLPASSMMAASSAPVVAPGRSPPRCSPARRATTMAAGPACAPTRCLPSCSAANASSPAARRSAQRARRSS